MKLFRWRGRRLVGLGAVGLMCCFVIAYVAIHGTPKHSRAPSNDPGDLGVRPNCSEAPVTYGQLLQLASNAPTGDMLWYLRNLPQGSFQRFTFVHDTKSVQNHLVSKRWPRVIRTTADGKLSIAYVCNPDSQDYGRIEIQRFDDETQGFLYTEVDLRARSAYAEDHGARTINGKRLGARRIHENPRACLNCHAPNPRKRDPDPRPIIAPYRTWPGFYGRLDDNLRDAEDELRDFQRFKESALSDPCYGLLPWPTNPDRYPSYPYRIGGAFNDAYAFRSNLYFTDVYSHLLARRLARRFWNQADFGRVRALLLFLGLPPNGVDSIALSGLKSRNALQWAEELRQRTEIAINGATSLQVTPYGRSPAESNDPGYFLYRFGQRLGWVPGDWTLRGLDMDDASYDAGVISEDSGRDTYVGELVLSNLIAKLAESRPELTRVFHQGRGVTRFFGPEFSCIDDLGGGVEGDILGLGQALVEIQKDIDREDPGVFQREAEIRSAARLRAIRGQLVTPLRQSVSLRRRSDLLPERVERGRQLVENGCKSCHIANASQGLPRSYHFFESEDSLRAALADRFRDDSFISVTEDYLQTGRMPPNVARPLPTEDRESILEYLESLAPGSI